MCDAQINHEDPSQPLSSGHVLDIHGPFAACLLSDLECEEIRFQKAWVAYLWARACQCGAVPHVSRTYLMHMQASFKMRHAQSLIAKPAGGSGEG
jgi:hypothetical protein